MRAWATTANDLRNDDEVAFVMGHEAGHHIASQRVEDADLIIALPVHTSLLRPFLHGTRFRAIQ